MRRFSTLFKNIGANSLTMGLMLIFQLLSVPIFLNFWGVELYGEWLTLNTLTAYFQMTDVGLNTATSNQFTFNLIKKDYKSCTILINNNIFFVLISFFLIFLVLISLIYLNFFSSLFNFKIISSKLVNICLLLLFAQVLIGTLNNLLNTFYIATGNYARGIMFDNLIRFIEYATLIAGLVLGLTLPSILVLGVIVKIIGLLFKYFDSSNFYKLHINIKYFDLDELKKIIIPSLAFFSFPIANSIIFQGFTLIINYFFGSASVVLFNTTRTLVNFSKSIIDILHKSIWPEITLSFGNNNKEIMKMLHRRTLAISVGLAVLTTLFLGLLGHYIYNVWTNNTIKFDGLLLKLLLLSLLTNVIWSSSNTILQATNNHKMFSLYYLGSAFIGSITALIILKLTMTLSYLPVALILVDIFLIFYVLRASLLITNDTIKTFFYEMLQDITKGKSFILRTICQKRV